MRQLSDKWSLKRQTRHANEAKGTPPIDRYNRLFKYENKSFKFIY
jgi:hypothetical protein